MREVVKRKRWTEGDRNQQSELIQIERLSVGLFLEVVCINRGSFALTDAHVVELEQVSGLTVKKPGQYFLLFKVPLSLISLNRYDWLQRKGVFTK